MDPQQSVTLVDARIEPARELGTITLGGGICTGPGVPEWASTLRNGAPAVISVEASRAPAIRLEGRYLWGGIAVHQPGHFVAEHAPRLLFTARSSPDSKIIFVLRKGASPEDLPGWFWDVLMWLGIDRGRVEFVGESPVSVENLTVFPQAEQLTVALDDLPGPRHQNPTGLPSQQYLEGLAKNFDDKGITPIENKIVYVSRAGMSVHMAGETYLEDLLRGAGVCVVRPEEHAVAEQMRLFAGARHLIFAEGSSLHFRQLIGYYPQRITVLQRRPGRQVARGPLQARADSLEYVNVVNGLVLGPFNRRTGIGLAAALPYTEPSKLMGAFLDAGIDLAPVWSEQAFDAALETDLHGWARYVKGISRKDTPRYALNALVSLTALGAPSELAESVAYEIEPVIQDVESLVRERDEFRSQANNLQRQLDSMRASASLKIGHALLSPAIYVKKRLSRRAR